MRAIFRIAGVLLALLVSSVVGPAFAQGTKEVKLTPKQVENFVAAQKDLKGIADKVPEGTADKPDPKIQAEVEGVAKKHGFANSADLDAVAGTILNVLSGIDPETKEFTDPPAALKQQIDEIRADSTTPEDEKKEALQEAERALKSARSVQYPENVEVVKKYYNELDAALGRG